MEDDAPVRQPSAKLRLNIKGDFCALPYDSSQLLCRSKDCRPDIDRKQRDRQQLDNCGDGQHSPRRMPIAFVGRDLRADAQNAANIQQ